MVTEGQRAAKHAGESGNEIVQRNSRQRALQSQVRGRGTNLEEIASDAGEIVELLRRLLVAFVLAKPPDELGTRIAFVPPCSPVVAAEAGT